MPKLVRAARAAPPRLRGRRGAKREGGTPAWGPPTCLRPGRGYGSRRLLADQASPTDSSSSVAGSGTAAKFSDENPAKAA